MDEKFFDAMNQIIDDNLRLLKLVNSKLKGIEEQIKKINDMTGTTARVEAIRKEIEEIGWKNIVAKYHPDINCDDPAANELFALYKYIFDSMQKKDSVA